MGTVVRRSPLRLLEKKDGRRVETSHPLCQTLHTSTILGEISLSSCSLLGTARPIIPRTKGRVSRGQADAGEIMEGIMTPGDSNPNPSPPPFPTSVHRSAIVVRPAGDDGIFGLWGEKKKKAAFGRKKRSCGRRTKERSSTRPAGRLRKWGGGGRWGV